MALQASFLRAQRPTLAPGLGWFLQDEATTLSDLTGLVTWDHSLVSAPSSEQDWCLPNWGVHTSQLGILVTCRSDSDSGGLAGPGPGFGRSKLCPGDSGAAGLLFE